MAGLAAAFARGAMTNHWADIGNATMVLVMGANPAENHPACMAHIGNARRGPHTWTDVGGVQHTTNKPAAKLVVVDPRKTRTALQADMYVRIRPGTDIAFVNAMVRYIMESMAARPALDPVRVAYERYHTTTKSGNFMNDASALQAVTVPKYSDATFQVAPSGTDYVRGTTSGISQFPQKVALTASDSVYTSLWNHVDHYTLEVAAEICGCTPGEISAVADLMIENSRCSSLDASGNWINDATDSRYRSATHLYAMGLTQHTYGSQNVKSFAVLQTLLGNMGRAGGGINALRGIHNVQGSTDMGLLYHLIPGYSGNPTVKRSDNAEAFGDYIDKLWGSRIRGNGYANAYKQGAGHGANLPGLQQAGFLNMTRSWFGGSITDVPWELAGATEKGANSIRIDNLYDLWPKGNGDNHIQMFRKMGTGAIKAAVVWGQNPAVTEPNQGAVRKGLEQLDTLVCVDIFENETASCDRKNGSYTYLIPACSHVEEAGSATNSGRTLQWRYEARKPAGNSKSDIELLLRFAYALDGAGAFSHISTVWARPAVGLSGNVYDKLYGTQYGWTPPADGSYPVFDSEAVAQALFTQMNFATYSGGTLWIYTGAQTTANLAKRRNGVDALGNRLFSNWGYSWLVNRRVLYNQGDVPGDVADDFQTPDKVARLFVPINSSLIDYGHANYRYIHALADKPDVAIPLPNTSVHKFPGRFPCHTEPYETLYDGTNAGKPNYVATYGRNTSSNLVGDVAGGTAKNLVFSTTPVAGLGRGAIDPPSGNYPLTLTTIRCVEHFQGGPITRNNWHNVEVEPEPWIELNSVDAHRFGIRDGQMVKVVTARTEGFADQEIESDFPRALTGAGFRARVGVGLQENQRVGVGVCAIPWHWGDRGLSAGSRANDLCLDAMDANTTIPEYKACLCRIEPM